MEEVGEEEVVLLLQQFMGIYNAPEVKFLRNIKDDELENSFIFITVALEKKLLNILKISFAKYSH